VKVHIKHRGETLDTCSIVAGEANNDFYVVEVGGL